MPPLATVTIAIAVTLDLAIGEPPDHAHPVAYYGRVIEAIEHATLPPRASTALLLLATLLAASLAAALTISAAYVHPIAATVTAAGILVTTTSYRALLTTASDLVTATTTDLAAAREQAPALVGRDPSTLDAPHLRSAAVESAAENLADGLIAPLLAFTVFAWALPLAAAAATWVKAVNTTDSMVGYPDHPLGRAPARLDDLVMWLPARLTAFLIALAAAHPTAIHTARRSATSTASPNAGWPMATLATVLSVQLEKPGAYTLGTGTLPTPDQARRGIRVVAHAGLLAILIAAVIAWF